MSLPKTGQTRVCCAPTSGHRRNAPRLEALLAGRIVATNPLAIESDLQDGPIAHAGVHHQAWPHQNPILEVLAEASILCTLRFHLQVIDELTTFTVKVEEDQENDVGPSKTGEACNHHSGVGCIIQRILACVFSHVRDRVAFGVHQGIVDESGKSYRHRLEGSD